MSVAAAVMCFLIVDQLPLNALSTSQPSSAGEVSASSAADEKYKTKRRLCDVIDRDLYRQVVGRPANVDSGKFNESGQSTTMTCRLYSARNDEQDGNYMLDVSVRLFDDKRRAIAEFEKLFNSMPKGSGGPQNLPGPWAQGERATANDGYTLLVRDGRLTMKVVLPVDPAEVGASGAEDLIVNYAEDSLAYLRA